MPETRGRVFEIGGPDVLEYGETVVVNAIGEEVFFRARCSTL